MDKVEKKKGRNENVDVTNNDMVLALEAYTKRHPNERINIKKLAEESGIKRNYWYYREGFAEKIEEINNIKYEDYAVRISSESKHLLELPDVDSLVETNYRNKKRLKEVIANYFQTIQEFYDSACEKYDLERQYMKLLTENGILNAKVTKLEEEKDKLKELCKYYKKLSRIDAVRSTEIAYRKENDIKENVISIKNNKHYALTTDNDEMKKMLDMIPD